MFDITATLFPDTAPPRLRPGPYAPLQQSALFARATRMMGARADYLSLPGTGAWVVKRKMPVFGTVSLISRGPSDLSLSSAKALRQAAGAHHLIVNAEDDHGADVLAAAGFWRIARPRHIAELPLDTSSEVMARHLSGKWRNRLRHAMRQGLHTKRTPLPPNPRHWIFAAEARAAKELGYQPMPPVMVAAIAAARPGAAQLFVARTAAGPIAAQLFIRHGKLATYQIGWSTAAGRAASAGNLLMWRAMLELQSLGVDAIDMGFADPDLAPGLTRFKCGAGANLRRLGGTWMTSAALPNRRRRSTASVMAQLREMANRPQAGPVAAHLSNEAKD